jgi:PhzF family phenazine biosynthesis protein
MRIPIYQVDAFTADLFSGNPAAVCFLESWIDDRLMQSIAAENNLSETAFLVPSGDRFELRWFTPTTEVALCGHATLASAFVLFELKQWPTDTIVFQTRWSGELSVAKRGDLLELNFPQRPAHPCAPPAGLFEALCIPPAQLFGSAEDLMVVLPNESAVRDILPHFDALLDVACRGVIVTAKGDASDFVSRFFAPQVGVREDPVTGSAHCVLTPYWAKVLGKTDLHAYQVSARGGELYCALSGDRVKIAGRAVLYLEGTITV